MLSGWLAEGGQRLGARLAGLPATPANHTNFFVYNLDPAGFIVTAADDWVEPVIAFSADGSFEASADNPLYVLLQKDMAGRQASASRLESDVARRDATTLAAADSAALAAGRGTQRRWQALAAAAADGKTATPDGASSISDVRVAPLMASRWNQKTAQSVSCYNYYCPPGPDGSVNNYYCGCVATAMGQLMRHWQHPAAAYGHAYTYANMPLNPQTVAPLTVTHRQAIGRLLRDCGTAVSMSYGSGGSSANMLIVDTALTGTFGFSNVRDIYRSGGTDAATRAQVLRSNLAGGWPVMLGISRSGSGHAVIADGFGYSSGTLYYHINMGWGGSYDAWYNLPTIDSYYTYDTVGLLVYNVYPSGSGEIIAGRVTDPEGEPVDDVTVTATGGYTATTGTNGYYGIRVPSAATYSLTATKSGFESATSNHITVGTSSTSYSGTCGNYFGADFTLTEITFTFTAFALTNQVVVRWTDPAQCGASNNTVHVRYSTSDYPTSVTHGTELYTGTNRLFNHSGLTSGQAYYYTIWLSHDGSTFFVP